MISADERPAPIHHNCSGKHAGMLTTCCFFDEDTCGYSAYDHPAQRRWFDVLGDLTGLDPTVRPHGVDGCGVPVLAWPLERLAYAFACFADPTRIEWAAAPRDQTHPRRGRRAPEDDRRDEATV